MARTPATSPGNLTHMFYTWSLPVSLDASGWGMDLIASVSEALESRPELRTCQGPTRGGLVSFFRVTVASCPGGGRGDQGWSAGLEAIPSENCQATKVTDINSGSSN